MGAAFLRDGSGLVEYECIFCKGTGVRSLAYGASRRGDRFLAGCFCSDYLDTVDSQGRVVLDVATDESFFCADELDLFDRVGRRSTCKCDLDAEPCTSLGDARGSLLVQGADDGSRLVDVSMVHCGCSVHFGDGVDACIGESQGSMVVALVGSCERDILCRSDSFASCIATI